MEEYQTDLNNEKISNALHTLYDNESELNKQTSDVDTIEVDLKRVEEIFKYLLELKKDPGINSNEIVIKGLYSIFKKIFNLI